MTDDETGTITAKNLDADQNVAPGPRRPRDRLHGARWCSLHAKIVFRRGAGTPVPLEAVRGRLRMVAAAPGKAIPAANKPPGDRTRNAGRMDDSNGLDLSRSKIHMQTTEIWRATQLRASSSCGSFFATQEEDTAAKLLAAAMNSTKMAVEIGAAFLCADLGITPETRDGHAAYIASWLKVLKDDKRAIFTAASHAQKAADYLHGLQPREARS